MRVGFTGSRDYVLMSHIENFVMGLARKYPDAIVVSGGRGNVDVTAEMAGVNCGLTVVSYRPKDDCVEVWGSTEGKPMALASKIAGRASFVANCFFRNGFIADSERVVGYWDLKSRGTADCLSQARGKSREVFVYGPDGELLSEQQVTNQLKEVLG